MSRRRALALELKSLADTGYAEAIGEIEPAIVTRVLDTLTAEVDKVRIDFAQHSEGFYFQECNPDISLARQLSYALRLRDAALARPEPAVWLSAQQLSVALEQLGAELKDQFLRTGQGREEVFAAYAADHGQDPRT